MGFNDITNKLLLPLQGNEDVVLCAIKKLEVLSMNEEHFPEEIATHQGGVIIQRLVYLVQETNHDKLLATF